MSVSIKPSLKGEFWTSLAGAKKDLSSLSMTIGRPGKDKKTYEQYLNAGQDREAKGLGKFLHCLAGGASTREMLLENSPFARIKIELSFDDSWDAEELERARDGAISELENFKDSKVLKAAKFESDDSSDSLISYLLRGKQESLEIEGDLKEMLLDELEKSGSF